MTVGRAERRRLGENPGPASMTTPDFFRSSRRRQALSLLAAEGLVGAEEIPVAHRVLRAAACTYLVATLVAIMELARIALEIALAGDE